MQYLADCDTYTKIAETTGTIQNGDTLFDLELKIFDPPTSETARFRLNPGDMQAFTDKEIYLRCLEPNEKIRANVVPFIVHEVCTTGPEIIDS